MENERKENKQLYMLILFVVLFIIDAILVINNKTLVFDNTISNLIVKIPERFNGTLKVITNIGGMEILPIIILIVCFVLVLRKKTKYSILILMNSILSCISYITIKNMIQRPRPQPFRFIIADGYSFPSGHSTNNMAFYGILIYLIWKEIKNKKIKIIMTIMLSIMILIMGITRIYFNVHYASDVIGGFLLGIICILICIITISKKLKI